MKNVTTDHRTRVTKMLIRKAFTEFLRHKPVQSITVSELCGSAGINRGTFYKYYTDIQDLLCQMEAEMLSDFEESLQPLLSLKEGELTPTRITAGVFQCLKDNSDLCVVTLGPFGDRNFALKMLNIGRDKCLDAYSKYFAGVSPKRIEYFYAFASAGCIGLLQKWLADGMTASAEDMAGMAEGLMFGGMDFLREGVR